MSENHSHEHTHSRSHEHTHSDGTVHSHEHEHSHTHEHTHEHSHGPVENKDQIVALLDYMVKHNRSHEAELGKVIEKLSELDKKDAAEFVAKAQKCFAEGNELLLKAYEMVK